MSPVLMLLVALCTTWTIVGILSVAIITRRKMPAHRTADLPAVTVLKPLSGADAHLRESLESFFVQDHPDYEILFGVEGPNDPAIAVVEELLKRHPRAAARLIVHGMSKGTNPKVRNLRGIIEHAAHDLVVISDSNIHVPPHYLSEMVAEYQAAGERAGLVTSMVRGTREDTLGAALESVQLAGFCAAGTAGPTLFFGDALVIGKSMLFSRAALDRLGGLESVSNVLAEDFVLGKMFQHAGCRVSIARSAIDNVTTGTTLGRFLDRQRRWAMLRIRLRPVAYLLEPVTSPVAMLPAALWLMGPSAFVWAAALLVLRDAGQWLLLSGLTRIWIPIALAPLREVMYLGVWLLAPFKRHVAWRGHRLRISAGSVAYVAR